MRFRAKVVCGMFFLGARNRCCTTCRGMATELNRPVGFAWMGCIILCVVTIGLAGLFDREPGFFASIGRRRSRVESRFQVARFSFGVVRDVAGGGEVVAPIFLREPVPPV